MIAATGIFIVATLEKIQPFEENWLEDHQDTIVDILDTAFSISMIFHTAEIIKTFHHSVNISVIWPTYFSIWLQVICAGAIMDFGLWYMHWLSHQKQFLSKLHALHHSPERLYWLNGERRHPLSALLMAGSGILRIRNTCQKSFLKCIKRRSLCRATTKMGIFSTA